MILDIARKVKTFLSENRRDILLAAIVFLMSVTSFGLGRLSAIWPQKAPIRVVETDTLKPKNGSAEPAKAVSENQPPPIRNSSFSAENPARGSFVASKSGSSYHLPDCPGAKQIKEENKVWFSTREAASAAGYRPAGNCPGLKPQNF